MLQQRLGFRVSFRGGANYNVHPPNLIDLVEVDFRENDMFFDPHGVVATAVKSLARHTAEVADAWHSHSDQTIKEFIHAVAAQGNL